MLQALVKKGRVVPEEVPLPIVSEGSVLIQAVNSCISIGTELANVKASGSSIISRAVDQPEQIKRIFDMVRANGIKDTISNVTNKLKSASLIGYSLSGVVVGVGGSIKDIKSGDRVAAAGGGIANHAEYADVPRNLVALLPDGLEFAAASTVALGSIVLQGVRRLNPQIGEYIVVFGTGMLGQIAVQILKSSGIRVLATDLDEQRLQIAKANGAESVFHRRYGDVVKGIIDYTGGHGADGVLFCAATKNSDSLSDVFAMTRKKGRVVMVGVWGNELNREDIYEKEIDFLISASYGPGRYDESYEQRGMDYPYPYVRWTENRNMEEYLRLLCSGDVNVKPLIQSVYPIEEVEQAYEALQKPAPPLAVLLSYGGGGVVDQIPKNHRLWVRDPMKKKREDRIRIGVIGAGSFASNVHLPNILRLRESYDLYGVCDTSAYKAKNIADRFNAQYATTDYREILNDARIDLVMITTRHNLHGQMVLDSLEAGKHTFVEKPLCINNSELDRIRAFFSKIRNPNNPSKDRCSSTPLLTVGFNRRFSKHMRKVKELIAGRINPVFIHYRMNAGYVPPDLWVQSEEGGGRIIGEACHIIDLFAFLIDAPAKNVGAVSLFPRSRNVTGDDNKSIFIEYEDGSIASLDYFAIGSDRFPKEYMEVHFDRKTIVVDDYRTMTGFGLDVNLNTSAPDKGHLQELVILAESIKGKKDTWPIELESIFQTTEITFKLAG